VCTVEAEILIRTMAQQTHTAERTPRTWMPAFRSGLIVLALLHPAWSVAQQADATNERSVHELLGPPVSAQPLALDIEFHLQDIDAIDDETETMRFAGTLLVRWQDPRQAFDTAEVGVREKFFSDPYLYTEEFPTWVPQVDLMNAYAPLETRSQLLRIAPDGTCMLVRAINGVAKIRLELRRYPFDRQQLALVFRAHGYRSTEVAFMSAARAVRWDSTALRIPQWTVDRMESASQVSGKEVLGITNGVSTFSITFDVSRDPLHMLRLVLIPLALIVILSWSVFWMDRSSLGDRMSVSFVGILTAVTYQVIIADTLPDISYITFIHGFVNLSFLLMCLTVLVNLMVGVLDQNNKAALGDRIDRTSRWTFPAVYAMLLAINWATFQ
jgi:hypothetical protein